MFKNEHPLFSYVVLSLELIGYVSGKTSGHLWLNGAPAFVVFFITNVIQFEGYIEFVGVIKQGTI